MYWYFKNEVLILKFEGQSHCQILETQKLQDPSCYIECLKHTPPSFI